MTEKEVYSIVTGDISESAALNIISAYGNRRVIEALKQAEDTIPGAARCIEEMEVNTAFDSCMAKLDEMTNVLISTLKQIEGVRQ